MNIPEPRGAHTCIERAGYLKQVAKKYDRDPKNLCLKFCYKWFLKENETVEDFKWCGSPFLVMDCARIQNICHWRGLAPRVYAVDEFDWNGKRAVCQLQDYAGEGEGKNPEIFHKVCKVVKEYGGVVQDMRGNGGVWNSAGGLRVGFKGFGWKDKSLYKKKVEEIIGHKIPKDENLDKTERLIVKVPRENLSAARELANYLGYFNIDYIGY